jgi:signal transduction histidine kinase
MVSNLPRAGGHALARRGGAGDDQAMSATRMVAVVLAALACGVAVVPVVLATDHQDARIVWAVFGPVVGWSFIGTGLYAGRLRPESRVGGLMILLGFAWFLAALGLANAALPYTLGQIVGGLWGAVFLQLVVTFPSGRLSDARDRAIVLAGYVIFTVASVPALLFAAPHELGCDDCPANVLLADRDATLARIALGLQALLYLVLFAIVLVRLTRRWRRTSPLERLQLTPVYASGLLTFLLVTVGQAGAGDVASWAAFAATAMLPFGFLAGLLRSHVARLDADLRARLQELRGSRARLVEAGDAERRRLERNLHDGAQGRLVAVALLVGQARGRVGAEAEIAPLLDRALEELKTSLAELRELARGLHPAVLSDRGLEPAVEALAGRSPVPVHVDVARGERLPAAIEIAAYYIVSEALVNVAKYARATAATVTVRRGGGRMTVEVADDGIGGADAGRGSGLRGLADRLEALDGTLAVDSPPGGGTRLRAEIPTAGPAT